MWAVQTLLGMQEEAVGSAAATLLQQLLLHLKADLTRDSGQLLWFGPQHHQSANCLTQKRCNCHDQISTVFCTPLLLRGARQMFWSNSPELGAFVCLSSRVRKDDCTPAEAVRKQWR